MLIMPYVFMLVIFTDNGVIMKPTVVATSQECATLQAAELERKRPKSVSYCVPPGAALEIEPEDKPST